MFKYIFPRADLDYLTAVNIYFLLSYRLFIVKSKLTYEIETFFSKCYRSLKFKIIFVMDICNL